MTGGHFDYDQNRISNIVVQIEDLIYNDSGSYKPETIERFKQAVIALKIAYVFAQRIDWLVSGDDGEEDFHKRLLKDLNEINFSQFEEQL